MTEAVQARAAQLFTAFEKRLNHDRAELIANGDTAASQAGGPDFDAVRFIAHRIVGSARMFGCEDLAEPAGKVEGLVDAGADVSVIVQAVNELAERIEFLASDQVFHVTFSCGLAGSKDERGGEALLALADTALNEAKAGGRNCIRTYLPGCRSEF